MKQAEKVIFILWYLTRTHLLQFNTYYYITIISFVYIYSIILLADFHRNIREISFASMLQLFTSLYNMYGMIQEWYLSSLFSRYQNILGRTRVRDIRVTNFFRKKSSVSSRLLSKTRNMKLQQAYSIINFQVIVIIFDVLCH